MLSIIIAAYNEEQRIEKSIRAIDAYLEASSLDAEIIAVNDGSDDGTEQLLAALQIDIDRLSVISYPMNQGKGHALRRGVLKSRGDAVLITDADLSTPIEEVEKLAHALATERGDIAIGSRALALSNIVRYQPWWRRTMGKTFNRIVKAVLLDGLEDTQCGFKLFRGPVARSLFDRATINRFAFDVEILALARQEGLSILEIPVTWCNSPGSKVNPVTDSTRMFFDTLCIRYRLGSAKCRAVEPQPITTHTGYTDTL